MNEKKFSIPIIVMSVIALAASFFCFCVEGGVLGIATIIVSMKKRDKYLVKIPIALAVIAVAFAIGMLMLFISQSRKGMPATSYWFLQLLFGKMPE